MIHKSFSFILAYPGEVVSSLIARMGPSPSSTILDPFCGTGTTLIESKLLGYRSIGIEINPVCALAARAKSRWVIDEQEALQALEKIAHLATQRLSRLERKFPRAADIFSEKAFPRSKLFAAVRESKLIERGWIGRQPAASALILSESIQQVEKKAIRELLMMSLLGCLVPDFSNLKYGPELYKAKRRIRINPIAPFVEKTKGLIGMISTYRKQGKNSSTRVIEGSSMSPQVWGKISGKIGCVITSPPYPAEHDYTRMTRLELVFGGFIPNTSRLVEIKRKMVPSSSKSIYVDQPFYHHVKGIRSISSLHQRILAESKKRTHGFARVYPRLFGDYFGAMHLHFKFMAPHLKSGAMCAYVVGDQSSFFGIRVPTARLLADVLRRQSSYKVRGITVLRTRRPTTGIGDKDLPEKILFFQKK